MTSRAICSAVMALEVAEESCEGGGWGEGVGGVRGGVAYLLGRHGINLVLLET